ncbi:MAG: DUF1217 domain-containing protein [Hyphomicrobiaceae bacterium]|nr:DUF1217 domain-containing protein [Hyphomicrobiaceae bacterium]
MSTFTSYMLLTRDYSRTLSNLAKNTQISNQASYYQANIGKVKSVDDLMKNDRLYTYVMKAAGLEDMTYAKAFIKKVLLSDLNDEKSFANKLTDKRYVELAKTFNFDAKGQVKSVSDVQSDLQEQTMIGLYNNSIIARETASQASIAAYTAGVDALTSVDDLFPPSGDRTVFDFALTAFGLGDLKKYADPAYFREILTKDLTDPTNPIQLIDRGTPEGLALAKKLEAFVSAFNFETDGSVTPGGAQSLVQKARTVEGYLQNSGKSSVTATLLYSTETYRNTIGSITSAQNFLDTESVFNFALTAYGLDPYKTDKADVLAALTSDLNDPASAANTLGLAFQRLAQAFNFEADGSLPAGVPPQDPDAIESTIAGYLANANANNALPYINDYEVFKDTVNKPGIIENVEDFLTMLSGKSPDPGNPTVTDNVAAAMARFVLKSFGFDLNSNLSSDFLRNVLTSDLSDPSSFANQQTDKRWATMASLFTFQPDGSVPADGIVATPEKIEELRDRYVAKGFGGTTLSVQASYAYRYDMKDVRNVDQFLSDAEGKRTASFSFVLEAYGFNRVSASTDYFRQIFTDKAFAAQQATLHNDPRLLELSNVFNFAADGSLAVGQPAQSKIEEDRMIERFVSMKDNTTGAYSDRIVSQFKSAIQNIRTVTDFLKPENEASYNFALAAFGIDPATTTKEQIGKVLSSSLDADDGFTSLAEQLGGSYLALAKAFNFNLGGGIVPSDQQTQSASQLANTVNSYLARNNPAALAETTRATAGFKANINSLESRATLNRTTAVDEFLADPQLYKFALAAYGLDPTTERKSDIRQALLANTSSSFSFLDLAGNQKYRALANALNFDADGSVGTPRQAQSASDALRLAQKYTASFPESKRPAYAKDTPTAQENLIKAESDYYSTAILKVANVDELVADKRAVAYIAKAFGLSATFETSDLKRILTSDLSDPKSFANSSKDIKYREIAATFNFDTKGQLKRLPEVAVQSSGGIFETQMDFLEQTLEADAGAESAGVRLALYFKRKASTLTSTYSLLADKALFEVTRVALGIPDAAARADLDVIARTIESKLKVADLKDPAKLEKFIQRFIALYDVQNNGGISSANSNALALLGGGSNNGFSQDTLSSLQNIRFRPF